MLLLALLAALAARPAPAQVRGRVVDAAEAPVAGAAVELWVGSRRAAGTAADGEGRFAVAADSADGVLRLTVRHPGMRTAALDLGSADTTLLVRMEAQPVLLAALEVVSHRRPACPAREDPDARALWQAMRRRYWQPGGDSVFVFGFLETRSGVGDREDAFRPEAGRVSAGWVTGALVEAHPAGMARSGYATSAAGGPGDRTAYWNYRALDQGTLQDFTGEYFGAAHTLSVLGRTPAQVVLAFCPRGARGRTGRIEGTLTLRADTTLAAARWRFRTPRPDEDAGGEAAYAPPDHALGRALLARESVFWRRTNRPLYYFEARTYTGWRRYPRDRPLARPEDLDRAGDASADTEEPGRGRH